MDRRSWPWKKKSSSEAKTESLDLASLTVKLHDEQTSATTLDEKNRVLSEKLSLAIGEITSKDNLVKQHVKVAEEAVSGWEKAEKEAAAVKKQLDGAAQQRGFLENRVTHLEGALKECMRELRTVRDEHDEASARWEKSRRDYEGKLSAAGDRLIESEAQRNALSRSLQERSRIVSELTEVKARVEAEADLTRARKEEVEKACSALKYEVQVLSKEVEIRNEEKEYNKKVADSASKQQLEHVKKIAKLETECQRLRGLVRKKLPGPAALAQMRMEVDGPSPRTKGGRNVTPVETSVSLDESSQADSDVLSDRLLAMEEETKMLKESLTKKNQELQSARLMCAKTASKLSLVEEQLERSQGGAGRVKVNSDSHSADSWASALVAQLEQFKKGKDGSYSEKLFESSNFDLMEDFAEMERLATTSSASTTASESGVAVHDERVSYEEAFTRKEKECSEARELCAELKKKLLSAEEHIRKMENQYCGKKDLVTDMDRIFAEARDRCASRKVEGAGDNLRSAVGKLVQLVESLAQETSSLNGDEIKHLVSAGNNLLQGKGDLLEFVGKLSAVLSSLCREAPGKESEGSSGSDASAEYNNYTNLQDDNAKLKAEKATMEQELQRANERIERLKVQLSSSEQLVSNLRVQLQSMEASKQLAESELTEMASVKAELESKFRASCIEMGRLQDNVAALESELEEQKKRHADSSLKAQASPLESSRSPQQITEDAARLQEREIAAAAEKLAECQRTIMALGKQLHSFSVPTGSSRGSVDLSDASESSADRMQQGFALKTDILHSESDDEESHLGIPQWKVQRSVSDMSRVRNARENIRKQEIYWSSALSPEPALLPPDNCQSAERVRKPSQDGDFFGASPVEDRSSSKNSGFSRFFHRRASLH